MKLLDASIIWIKEYKRYDENFKRMIVELLNNGKSVSEVSCEDGIALSNIRQWTKLLSKIEIENHIFDKAEFLKLKKTLTIFVKN